jgi:hypothetical protein
MLGHGASFFETRMARDRGETDEAPPTIRLGYRCIALPGGGAALRGAVAFMGCAQEGWTLGDLVGWFDEHLVSPERMKRPRAFHEHGVPPVPAPPRADPRASVERITRTARERVLVALGGLHSPIQDGHFLQAAIHARRMRRAQVKGRQRWIATPRETDALSDIVLSLFAADILFEPTFYREHLCICQNCARVSIASRDAAAARLCSPCSGRDSFDPSYPVKPDD